MKLYTLIAAFAIVLTSTLSTTFAADLYWDVNGPTGGLINDDVAPYADGTWDAATANWSTSAAGTDPAAWADSNKAIFQVDGAFGDVGVNAEPDGVVTVAAGTRVVSGMTVDNGWVALSGSGNVTVGAGGLLVNNNSVLSIDALTTPVVSAYAGTLAVGANTITINSGGVFSVFSNGAAAATKVTTAAGANVILNGGTIRNTGTTAGGNFLTNTTSFTISAASGVGYFDVPNPANTGSLYSPSGTAGIKGEGGTLTNGGFGTFYKIGDGELRSGAASNNTFKRLVVEGSGLTPAKLTGTTSATSNTGEYRLNAGTENAFGAIPLTFLPDAITLTKGDMIGTGFSLNLHPNRGVVIGTGGGGTWVTGGGLIAIPGVVSGSGPLLINGATGGGSMSFDNPNNTWSGDLIMRNGFLILNQSLVANHIEGENQAGATLFGTVNIAPGESLTVGSDDQSTQFDGRVTGAQGTFTKVGTGTLTLDTHAAGGEWTNLGTVNINGGSVMYTTTNAGFGSFTTVNIAAGATFDMNGIQDQFGGLHGAGDVINHNVAINVATQNSSNLNIRGAGTYDLSGTINGSGLVIKNGTGTQTFSAPAGNNYAGGTSVIAGRLNVNNGSGSGTGSGAVNVTTNTTPLTNGSVLDSGGVLGGIGIVAGAITVDVGGHVTGGTGVAPDNKVLTASSTVEIKSGGSLDAYLGAPTKSDRLKVTSANGVTLNAGGLLTLKGASGGISGTYTVLEHSGYAVGTASTLSVNNATGFEMSGSVDDTSGTDVKVTLTNTVQDRRWTFDGSGSWSAAAADGTNWDDGSQVNGPGAIGQFLGTGTASAKTVTIADSDKLLGTLALNDTNGGTYKIAASGSRRLIMDSYNVNPTITVGQNGHEISAPMTTNKVTEVTANGNTLNITGGLLNNAGAGLVNTGSGTVNLTAGPGTNTIVNRGNSKIENAGLGSVVFTVNGGHLPTNTTTAVSNSVNNDAGGRILNSGDGNMTINLITTSDVIAPATTRNAAISLFINNGIVENSGSGILAFTSQFITATPGAVTNSNAITVTATASDVINNAGLPGQFINSGSGQMTIAPAIAASGGVVFSNSSSPTASLTVSGVISGGLGLGDSGRVYIAGTGEVALTGLSTYTGGTILQSGKLRITAETGTGGQQLGGLPAVVDGFYNNITFDGGTLKTAPTALLTLSSNRGMYAKGVGTIETAGTANTVFGGRIHGTGNLAKTGANALLLNGSSITYSGTIAVNEGTLGGTGMTAGSVTVNSTGHLAPGASAGIFSVGGATTFNIGSNFDVEIGGLTVGTQYDQLAVTGAATLNGTLNGALINAFTPSIGNSFTILTASSVTGTFASTALPTLVGAAWQVVYNPTSVVLNVISGSIAGDYNGDGSVNAADYVVWRKDPASFGGPGGYTTWRQNFHNPPGSGSGLDGNSAVPEPTVIGLLLIGVVGLATGRRKR